MNKKQRNILLIVILLATLGLISTQVYWLMGASQTKEDEFDAQINYAINNVVTHIWKEETITNIIDNLPHQDINDTTSLERQISRQGITYISRNQKVINYNAIDSMKKQMPSFMNDSGIVDFLKKENREAPSGIAKRYFLEQIVERMVMLDLPTEQRVSLEQVDTLMTRELQQTHIDLAFELAIVDQNNEILISSFNFFPKPKNKIYERRLFPNDPDAFVNKHYLRIYFPKQQGYLFQDLGLLIFSSITLIIMILTIFAYTLWVILRQKKLSDIKNDFIGNITHELKTPIATISLAAQMMEDKNVSDSAKNMPRLSKMIKDQSTHLTFLVEKVLQSSIFESGAVRLKFESKSVHQLIKNASENISLQLQAQHAVLELHFGANEDVCMLDVTHFLNCITNLIDNAIKYKNGPLHVKISTENEGNGIKINVCDNGIGIDKIYHSRVFEQFFRVPAGNVHNVKGFGLGLNYVKQMTQLQQGKINITSELGKGTCFTLYFPLAQYFKLEK